MEQEEIEKLDQIAVNSKNYFAYYYSRSKFYQVAKMKQFL